MVSAPAISTFAAPRASLWPPGSTLDLPAGNVLVRGRGKLLIHGGFIAAVVLSPDLCISAVARVGTTQNICVLEQLVGFLHAHQVLVLRTGLRCPARLFGQGPPGQPSYLTNECLVYWIRAFLGQDVPRQHPRIPKTVILPGRALETLEAVSTCLRGAAALIMALIATDALLLGRVLPDVFQAIRRCEFGLLKVLQDIQSEEQSPEFRELFAACERSLRTCARLCPSYELQSQFLARLI